MERECLCRVCRKIIVDATKHPVPSMLCNTRVIFQTYFFTSERTLIQILMSPFLLMNSVGIRCCLVYLLSQICLQQTVWEAFPKAFISLRTPVQISHIFSFL